MELGLDFDMPAIFKFQLLLLGTLAILLAGAVIASATGSTPDKQSCSMVSSTWLGIPTNVVEIMRMERAKVQGHAVSATLRRPLGTSLSLP